MINENLEIIKDRKKYIWESSDGQYNDVLDEIDNASECMAAEIEQQKIEIKTIEHWNMCHLEELATAKDKVARLKAENENIKDELEFWKRCTAINEERMQNLKAELASRPEIATCGECKHWRQVYVDGELGDCDLNKCVMFRPFFCSKGVKKESEDER